MESLTKSQLTTLVNTIFNDLLDDMSLGERSMVNGHAKESMDLYKETLRAKNRCLAEIEKLDSNSNVQERSKGFRNLSVEIRRKSLSLVERMSALGY